MATAPQPTPPVAAEEKPAGGSKKLLIIILGSVLGLLLLGGGGLFLFRDAIFGSGSAKEEAEAAPAAKRKTTASKAAAEEEDAEAPAPKKKKKRAVVEAAGVLPLEPFTVNLQEVDSTRYMRLVIQLGLSNADLAKEAGENAIMKARIRDAIMRYITTLTSEQVLSQEGKEKLIETVIERTNEILEDAVVDVYIQELIVQ